MGWRRCQYGRKENRVDLPQVIIEDSKRKDLLIGDFIFTDHFFEKYRERVFLDHARYSRSKQEIAELAIRGFEDSKIPKRFKPGDEYRILVEFYENLSRERMSFGKFHIPMKRDIFNISSCRICPVTILYFRDRITTA